MAVKDSAYIQAAKDQADAMMQQAVIETAIMTALALWKRNSGSSIANMQQEIADRQTKLAERVHNHAKNFWPYEQAFVDDAFGIGKASAQYDAMALSWSDISDKAHQAYKTKMQEALSDRCINLTSCESANWSRTRQSDRSNVMSFADRQAEGRMDALNDQRYARQYAALGLGRGYLSSLVGYQRVAGAAGGNARDLLLASINNGIEAYGYYKRSTDNYGSRIQPQWGVSSQGQHAHIPYVTNIDLADKLAGAFTGGDSE